MSCQGCRVLRKGCKKDCVLRDCIQWIPNPQSQANATMFLVKFYGRVGLSNLIEPVHQTMRPELCKSLLFEACARIMNPIYGSVGMIHSANWASCQAAVEKVLKGQPIMKFSVLNNGSFSAQPVMPLEVSNIRHTSKDRDVTSQRRVNKKSKRTMIAEENGPIVESTDIMVRNSSINHGIRGCNGLDYHEGRKFVVGSSSQNHDGLLELTLASALPPSGVIESSDTDAS